MYLVGMNDDTGSEEKADWYYTEDGRQCGPVTHSQLVEMRRAGRVHGDTFVWHPFLMEWARYDDALRATAGAAPAEAEEGATETCSMCGRQLPPDEVITFAGTTLCGECKPLYFEAVREGAALPGVLALAGFWPRLGAKIIDWLLLGVVSTALYGFLPLTVVGSPEEDIALYLMVQGALMAAQYVIGATYTAYFLGAFGATPGKMAFGLRVVTADGRKVSYLRGGARYFAELLSGIVLYVGYLVAIFDGEKRALHDHLCATRVVHAGGGTQ